MPLREYSCRKCGNFEVIQKPNEEVLAVCPTCGEVGLVNVFGLPAKPQFKGSGFYETDYKKQKDKQ